MARRQPRTFESYVDDVKAKIKEKPEKALREIGKLMVREVRKKAPKKSGNLRKNIQYFYRKRYRDLQIGIKPKAFYGGFIEKGTEKVPAKPFIEPTVMEHLGEIQELIKMALAELTGEEN